MCTVCGCAQGETRIEGDDHEHVGPDGKIYRHAHGAEGHGHDHHGHHHHGPHDAHHHHADDGAHEHVGPDGRVFRHSHHGAHHHHQDDDRHPQDPTALDAGAAFDQPRLIAIEQDILAKNDGLAAINRQRFAGRGVFVLNLMSSPGSGKTTLLTRTLTDLKGRFPVAVIEGDQQTSFDADRIRATDAPAIQVNTGKGCHLDAAMVAQAADRLGVAENSVLFIENVGNLVCPAGFDLGETHRVVVLSVTEGEDKPLKYPAMFAGADLLLVNKVDLLPHLTFDVERMIAYAQRLKPSLAVIELSATNGQGMADWYDWIENGLAEAQAARSGD
jgi:hydrogenase nickel incorporation protein HypB